MAYIQGEGRSQGTLFPVVLDDFILGDHVCRVIDASVGMLMVSGSFVDRSFVDRQKFCGQTELALCDPATLKVPAPECVGKNNL